MRSGLRAGSGETLAAHMSIEKSNDYIHDINDMNFTAFDLNLLRVFDALMRERSATRAGEKIGLSQPAISAALSRLRHSLGDQLFVRLGNEMVPTPRADAIADAIRQTLKNLEDVLVDRGHFDPASAERTFTLRGADFFSIYLMPELAVKIRAQAPGVRLRFLDSSHGDLSRLLQEGSVDVVLERPFELGAWISSAILFDSPFAIIAARSNREIGERGIRDGAELPMDLFCGLPHAIRSTDGSMAGVVDDALHRSGHRRNIVLALPHFHAVAAAVARGELIAAVPLQLAEAVAGELGLSVFLPPFRIPVPEIKMYWHSRHDSDPPQVWFRNKVMEAVGSIWPTPGGA